MHKKLLLLWGVLFLSLPLWAQKGKDFLLTMKEDTLYGKIKIQNRFNSIAFHYQGERVGFHATTIKKFGIHQKGKTRLFKTIDDDRKKRVIVEILIQGKLNLYRYNTIGDEDFTRLEHFRYFLGKKDTELVNITPISYKNALQFFMQDQPNLLAQKIAYGDIPKIIEQYNELTTFTAAR